MKDITVKIFCERYMADWLCHHFGRPVRFPSRSYENEVLRRSLTNRVTEADEEIQTRGGRLIGVELVIPDSSHRRPEYYNRLSKMGRRTVMNAIDGLFRVHLWTAAMKMLANGQSLNRGIDRWCAANGISLDAREGVRQKFYRMRLRLRETGIILGEEYDKTKKILKNHCHETGENEQLLERPKKTKKR